jgi:hypothetical protein
VLLELPNTSLTRKELHPVISGPMPLRCAIHAVYKGGIQTEKDEIPSAISLSAFWRDADFLFNWPNA